MEPLVSIVVISYNSEKTIIETLESIYNQKYKRLELIISDDCSKDKTIQLASEWIKNHESRFENCKIISSEHNSGIPANLNRGVYKANGEWIKSIAADDALEVSCISDNVEFVQNHPEVKICHSIVTMYNGSFSENNKIEKEEYRHSIFTYENSSPELQLRYCYIGVYIKASTLFFNKELILQAKGFDERIKLCEDWPMYIKVCRLGVRFFFLDKHTVKYRLNPNSIYTGSMQGTLFPNFFSVDREIYRYYIKDCGILLVKLIWKYKLCLKTIFSSLNLNKNNICLRILFKIFSFPEKTMEYLFLSYSRYIYLR